MRARCCAPISRTRPRRSARYRERVVQCEALQEYAIAEDIREILRQEQEHQIDLATALGEDVPNVSKSIESVCDSKDPPLRGRARSPRAY